jgi:hypothetical protein
MIAIDNDLRGSAMRKFLFAAIVLSVAMSAQSAAQAQPYGPGMMGDGYGYGPGYGRGFMMGPGYGPGYMMGPGYGPGMMGYGYGPDNRGYYRRGRGNRGQRLCWKETDSRGYGYYAPCRN